MKQIFQNPKSGKTQVKEVIAPSLKKGGVLVQNEFSLISPGTERNIVNISKKSLIAKAKERPDYVDKFFMLWKTKGFKAALEVAKSKLDTDIALGYSSSGRVIKVANDVSEFKVGDRVSCAGQNYASHAEFVFVPKNLCVKVPDEVSSEEAAFGTLGAIVLQGIHQAKLSPGESVGVVGLGLLGQIAVRILKSYGFKVVGFDIQKNKIEHALSHGASSGILLSEKNWLDNFNNSTSHEGLDAVLVYASSSDDSPLKTAVTVCRDRARIVQIGNVQTNIPWRDFYKKELSYVASRSYGPGRYDENYEEKGNDYPLGYVRWTERRNIEEFLHLLSRRLIDINDLISGVYTVEEGEAAYSEILKPKTGSVFGLLLQYGDHNYADTVKINYPEKQYENEPKVNIGLIGVGSFAKSTILPHLAELQEIKNGVVRLRAIASSSAKDCDEIAKKWDASYVTSDYHDLLNDPEINLIICATRHGSHAKIAEEVLRADKNLYIEKPLALNEESLMKVMEAASSSEGRLYVGFNRRFAAHSLKTKEIFTAKGPLMINYRVNSPKLESNHWSYKSEEGGRLIGECCHFIDWCNFITSSAPAKISVASVPVENSILNEENLIINIEYKNGSACSVFYSALGNFKLPKEYIEIYGGGLIVTIDNFKDGKIIRKDKTEKINLKHQNKGYTEELKNIINAIQTGAPSPISLEEIEKTHLSIFKAGESLKTGKIMEI